MCNIIVKEHLSKQQTGSASEAGVKTNAESKDGTMDNDCISCSHQPMAAAYLNFSSRAPNPTDYRSMIERVAQHQAALTNQGRNDSRICCKAHAKRDGIFAAHKLRYQLVKLQMLPCGPCVGIQQMTSPYILFPVQTANGTRALS